MPTQKAIKHLAAIRCRRSSFHKMITQQDINIPIVELSNEFTKQVRQIKLSFEKAIKDLQTVSTKKGRNKLTEKKTD